MSAASCASLSLLGGRRSCHIGEPKHRTTLPAAEASRKLTDNTHTRTSRPPAGPVRPDRPEFALDVPPGARAGGPGGGSLAPDLAPVWRQVCSLKTKLSTEFICRTDGRTQLTTAHRQTGDRRTSTSGGKDAPCTLYRNYAFTEQRATLPPSFITRSPLFPSCAVDEPGSSTKHAASAARSLVRAPASFFVMGLAALGPPGTWRDRQVTPT
eukprot:scaffold11336_cov133-Isochrysis_galbana.AAC.4